VGEPLDLQAAASAEGAWTVSELTRRARAAVEMGLPPLWVRGEISDFKKYPSGHWYFSLRDRGAQVRCVMWSKENRRLPALPADGVQVFVFARPTVWEERGEFRLTVWQLLSTEAGGLWQVALERAKAALARDGLLDPARKRRLPRYPSRIAVITSPAGAALRDIVSVVGRRWPVAQLLVLPTRVQGDGAERDLCNALAWLHRLDAVDCAIVGRGGGAKEDLWVFNSERVARAVAAAPVPVVSAVGHETDITLCDLVADLRAATPSAAAEAVTPDRVAVLAQLGHTARRLGRGLHRRAERTVDRLARTNDRLAAAVTLRFERTRARLATHSGRLDALSPLRILARGYAVPLDERHHVLRRVADFSAGRRFRLRVSDGDVAAQATES